MTHSIALHFEDGVTRFVTCGPAETVADAAYRAGINIPLDCRDGACGTCKTRVEAGAYSGGDYIEDALTDEEAAEGYALACQMRPQTDMVVQILAGSAACKTKPGAHTATLAALQRLSDSTIAFTLDGVAPGFLPGQYVSIGVPGTAHARAYSFSSAPGAPASFLVRHIPGGAMSGFLAATEPGITLSFIGPSGSFYLRDVVRPVLMLAGGTGLAPFLSMLGRLAQTGAAYPVHLVYGVTNDADLVLTDALDAYVAANPNFTYTTVVADAGSAHPQRGYVTNHLDPAALHCGDVDVYVCGPPAMVDAVRAHLAAQNVTPARFYTEKFLAAA